MTTSRLSASLALVLAASAAFAFQPPATPAAPAEKAPAQPAKTPDGEKPKPAPAAPAPQPADSPFAADKAEEVGKGYGFTEGPTWVPGAKGADGKASPGFFIFCDMGGNKVYRYDNGTAAPVALREPSSRAVGATSSANGTIYTVDTETRSITSWTVGADGKPSATKTVADKIGEGEGEQLGGMNDIAVTKDGVVFVTHGSWFLPRGSKSPFMGILRVGTDGKASKAADDFEAPNGITISPDGKTLYATEFRKGAIIAYDLKSDGTIANKRTFADLKKMAGEQGIKQGGGVDGLRCDSKGNVFSTGPGGIWAVSPEGKFLGHLTRPGTNIAFGGEDGKTLLITTGTAVFKVPTKNAGAGW